MQELKAAKLDIKSWYYDHYPNTKVPSWVLKLLGKIVCEKEINQLFADAPGKKNMDFIDSCMKSMNVKCHVVGAENLPHDGSRLIFAGNHPQGGIEAICISHVLGHAYDGKLKIYANELLCILEPLKEMFLPVFKHGNQNKENVKLINDFYDSDYHLLTFPAGVTSFRHQGKIIDHPWRKNFIKTAVNHERTIVPIYFDARNSNLFYRLENFRKAIHFPLNFEVLMFAKEFFKQRGKTFTLYIGKPMDFDTFDKSRSYEEWTEFVREKVYDLPKTKV